MIQSPEPIDSDRIERILRGDVPEGEREARFAGVVRELRAETPGASPELRERVRALTVRSPMRSGLFWSGGRRRLALVLAPAFLFAVGAGAAVYGLAGRDDRDDRAMPLAAAAEPADSAGVTLHRQLSPRPATKTLPTFGAYAPAPAPETAVRSALDAAKVSPPFPGGNRVRDVQASLRLRVPNSDRLSDAAAEAMRITRTLGGYVAYVDVDTAGKDGRATLTLRVPVGSVQDAIVRLSDLGTIVGQHVSINDRQVEVDTLARRISSLRGAVARTRIALSGANSDEERARLRLQLDRQLGLLKRLTRTRGTIVREASFARIDLAVVTGKAPKGASTAGPFRRAMGDALHVLAVATAGAVFVLILLTPVLVLAALVAFALRSRRRRIEERLLERLGPAAGQPREAAPGQLG